MLETPVQTTKKPLTHEVHLRDYFIVLARHKWLIIAALVVVLSSTILYLRRQEPVYQAHASIIIEPKSPRDMVFQQSVEAISLDLETQIEVIKTTPVLALVVSKLELTEAAEGTLEFFAAVEKLKNSITIGFVKNTKMVTITAKHSLPEKAQGIANEVAQAYIDQDRIARLQAGREAVSWLSTQLADLKTKLKSSEDAFQRFKEREGMITLDSKRSEDLEEISKLNASYLNARAKRMEIDAIVGRLEVRSSESLNIPIALLESPTLQSLGQELSKLQTELADKRRRFKDTYPGITDLKDRIKLTEQKILMELKRQRDFLKAQEDAFLIQQEAKNREAVQLSKKELEYLTLEREVTTNREMYNTLVAKVGELSLAGDTDLNNIRIVQPAELPTAPMGNKRMTIVFGGLLGLFLGIGFAFFLEYMSNTIRTPDDAEQYLGMSVLGVVPQVPDARKVKTPFVVLDGQVKSAPAEAYRSLRTNLLFSGMDSPKKTIVVTSAGPKEGKTITTINLGAALAQAGQKVLLVDADLRRPMIHRTFQADRHRGLSTVLAGELSLEEAIVKTQIPNLSIITSGTLPPNPSEVLGSSQMKEFICSVREKYDLVLFDSAPILGMADTSVLASETDGAVIVIKTGEVTRKALKMAAAQMEQVNSQILGVVLNNVNMKKDRYYYYYYYYYYYTPYGEEGEKVKKRRRRKKE